MIKANPIDIKGLPPFLRVRQICSLIGCSRSAWYSWMAQGRCPPGKLISPGTRIWATSDILAFAQAEER
jgi:predicted DNA-binding transcriptional regulator AlpA